MKRKIEEGLLEGSVFCPICMDNYPMFTWEHYYPIEHRMWVSRRVFRHRCVNCNTLFDDGLHLPENSPYKKECV